MNVMTMTFMPWFGGGMCQNVLDRSRMNGAFWSCLEKAYWRDGILNLCQREACWGVEFCVKGAY